MNVLALTGPRRLGLLQRQRPELARPDDVRLRMEAVGVCGSDVHYFTQGRIGDQVVTYPQVVGHEGAGVVAAVGPAVRHVRPGDRVVIEPAVTCGTCDQCRAGRANTCRRLRFLGCPGQLEGCLAEYLVMPERCCLPVAPGTTAATAALIEPLAIGLYAVRLARLGPGARVTILGAGPIGLSVLLCARHAGAARVDVIEPRDYRRAAALAFGADRVLAPDAARATVGATEFDVAFECCGEQDAVDLGLALLAPGGTLMMIGIPDAARISLPVDLGRRRELTFRNVRRQCGCTADALALVASGALRPDPMVTHRFPLAQAAAAFELVAAYGDGVIKAMIEMTPRS